MKRLLVLFCLFVSVFLCFACDNKEDSNNNKLNISKDLSNSFKSAYALSISDYVEDVEGTTGVGDTTDVLPDVSSVTLTLPK